MGELKRVPMTKELSESANLALLTEFYISLQEISRGVSPGGQSGLNSAFRLNAKEPEAGKEIVAALSEGATYEGLLTNAQRDDYKIEHLIMAAGNLLDEADDRGGGALATTPFIQKYIQDIEGIAGQNPVDHARVFETTLSALSQIETVKLISSIGSREPKDVTQKAEVEGSTHALMIVAMNVALSNGVDIKASMEKLSAELKGKKLEDTAPQADGLPSQRSLYQDIAENFAPQKTI